MKTIRFGIAATVLASSVLLASCSAPDREMLGPAPSGPVTELEDTGPGGIPIPEKELDGGGAAGGIGRPASPIVAGQVVVDLNIAVTLAEFNSRWGTTTVDQIAGAEDVLVQLPPGRSAWDLSFDMVAEGDCDVAEPNYQIGDPEANQGVVAFVETGHIFSDVADQDALARIGVPEAQLLGTGAGVTVAVIDTGIDGTHPDLSGSVVPGWDFVDGDGDASESWDGVDNDLDGFTDEGKGHGTHVAGIIHAVAPGALLMPVRVLGDEGMGTSFDVARGIRWAVDNGADIINLSLGMTANTDVIKDAVDHADNAGVVLTASVGNEARLVSYHYPAKRSAVIGVTATDAQDLKAPYSSYGSIVSMSAPGDAILSTYPEGSYAIWSGTSFATPMVSGAAAIRLELYPAATSDEIQNAIENTAAVIDYTGLPYFDEMGKGRIDIGAMALQP